MNEYNLLNAMEGIIIKRKTVITAIYEYFVNNKYSEYDEFINGLKKIDIRINEKNIQKIIDFYQTRISSEKGKEMNLINKLQLCKKDNDLLNMMRISKKLNEIENRKKQLEEYKDQKSNVKRNKTDIYKIIEKVKMILDDKLQYNDLTVSEKEILRKKINIVIQNIGTKKYAEFCYKIKNIEQVSVSEVNNAVNLIDFKIQELFYKLDILNNITDKNAKDVLNVPVAGENELSDFYTKNYGKLKTWKLKKLNRLLIIYKKLINLFELIYSPECIDLFKRLEYEEKVLVKNNDTYLLDFYDKFLAIYNEYEKINNSVLITTSNKEEIKKEYINMAFRNNMV